VRLRQRVSVKELGRTIAKRPRRAAPPAASRPHRRGPPRPTRARRRSAANPTDAEHHSRISDKEKQRGAHAWVLRNRSNKGKGRREPQDPGTLTTAYRRPASPNAAKEGGPRKRERQQQTEIDDWQRRSWIERPTPRAEIRPVGAHRTHARPRRGQSAMSPTEKRRREDP